MSEFKDSFFCSDELKGIITESSLCDPLTEEVEEVDKNLFAIVCSQKSVEVFLLKYESDSCNCTFTFSYNELDPAWITSEIEDIKLNMFCPETKVSFEFEPSLVRINAAECIITLVCSTKPREIRDV